MTAPRRCASTSARPTRAAAEHAHQVGRLAARQVDEVGLADRLGRGGIVGAGPVADEHRLDLGAELAEMRDAHRRPAREDLLAIGEGGRRQDRDARPGAAGRRPAGRHRTRPSRGGTRRRRRAPRVRAWRRVYAPCRHRRGAATLRGSEPAPVAVPRRTVMTSRQRWTLICTVIGSGAVFLDGTIVNAALKHIGQELPGSFIGVLEGQAYIVSGYLAVLAALLILSGALSDHYGRRRVYSHRAHRVRRDVGAVRPRPDARAGWSSSGSPRAPRAPCSSRARWRSSPTPSTASARARAFGIWAASTSALTVLGPIVGGTHGRHHRLAVRVPHQRARCSPFALWATLRHVQESRDTETTGRFDWLGALVAALAVGGLAFGVIRGAGQRVGRPGRLDRRSAIGVVSLVAVPDPHGPPAQPARPARAVPVTGVRDGQPRHVLHLRRAVRHVLLPGGDPPGRPRLHGARRGHRRDPRAGSCCRSSRPGSAPSPDGWARAGSSSPARC